MRIRVVPASLAFAAMAARAVCLLIVLIAGGSVSMAALGAGAWVILIGAMSAADYRLTRAEWLRTAPRMTRILPAALAVGVQRDIDLVIEAVGALSWNIAIYDHSDPSLLTEGLPAALTVGGGKGGTYT